MTPRSEHNMSATNSADESAGPVVLITGCSSGIGFALAEEFTRRGCRVVATARNMDGLSRLLPSPKCRFQLDVSDHEQARAVVSAVRQSFGRIDILINNAGYGLMAPLMEVSAEALQAQLLTNTVAPLILAQLVAPIMREYRRGVIANIGSVSGQVATPFAGAYCASKAAINSLSDVLRMELAPFGIQVVSVLAGAVRSGFGDAALSQRPLATGSWYRGQEAAIRKRASASQIVGMEAGAFAARLAGALLVREPPPILHIGPRSGSLPFLKAAIPVRILDRLLMRQFSLDHTSSLAAK